MRLVLLALLAGLVLLPAMPSAAAGSCVVARLSLVCEGQPWCTNDGLCGTPECVTPTGPCVLNAPDGYPSNCLVGVQPNLGLVCTGQPYCDPSGCYVPICVTNSEKTCLNDGP
ncbi:MAG: hypothetical protein QOE90_2834 [Thermoplasmata archaeon]|jgi:hypothetical protein|nr:hypothetical protein [Thermoplasmata archaeon]